MGKRINTAVWLEKYNRWQINVQKDGKRKSFSSYKPGRIGQREANAKADAWLDDGILGTSERIERLFPLFLDDLKARTSFGHWRNEESRWRTWIQPVIGNKKISSINNQHLQEIINQAYKANLSKKSLMDIRNTLAAFFKFCRKNKVTNFYPEDIIIPKSAIRSNKKILQPKDIQTLFSVDSTILYQKRCFDNFIYAYRFQVVTGLRPGELLGLKWTDIVDNCIHVQRSINNYNQLTQGKNENAVRSIMLSDIALKILDQQKKLNVDSEYIFGEITQNCYRIRWKKYCASNNITVVSPYELRHTFVSAVQILPESMVKSIAGHSKNMDTFGIYGHDFGERKDETAKEIDRVFKQIISK